MLITHTTAKRQGSKVAQLLPPSPHVFAHSPNGFVGEILFLLSRIQWMFFENTHVGWVTPQTLPAWNLPQFQPSVDDPLLVFK